MSFWFWPFAFVAGSLMFLVMTFVVVFWIWMIVDAAKRKFKNDVEKVVWIGVIVLGSWLGALVYLLVIRMSNPRGLFKK